MEDFQQIFYLDIWPIVATLANTLILFLLLKKFLFKPVKKMIDDRKETVETMYDRAATAEENAKKLEQEYESKIGAAKEEASEIIREASKKATIKGEEIQQEATLKASQMVEKANNDIKKEKKKVLNELKNEISDIAIMAASKVLEKEVKASDHQKFIDEFIDKVG